MLEENIRITNTVKTYAPKQFEEESSTKNEPFYLQRLAQNHHILAGVFHGCIAPTASQSYRWCMI